MLFGAAIRGLAAKKLKPKMKSVSLKTPPEQTQIITRTLFDIVRDHGPLTIADTWNRVQEAGVKELSSKGHMKKVLRWMKERQKLKLICNHAGSHKQFLYTTWFTNASVQPTKQPNLSSRS
ncbi:hypothetical protein V2J09_018117 [Rumex salicifolius]